MQSVVNGAQPASFDDEENSSEKASRSLGKKTTLQTSQPIVTTSRFLEVEMMRSAPAWLGVSELFLSTGSSTTVIEVVKMSGIEMDEFPVMLSNPPVV